MSYEYTDLCALVDGCREAITLLFPAGSDESARSLIAGTKSRLYASNDYTGNWRVLADGLGGGVDDGECNSCSDRRFRATQIGNYVLFTNDFDPVLSWKIGDPPTGLNLWSAQYIEDLLIIGITRARCVTTFNGFAIVGNVEIEGQQKSSRIYWSDYNAPLSWIPSDTSLASYHEFGLGEKILRVEPLGRYLMVYTDKAIYQGVQVSDSDLVFQFNTVPTDNPIRYEHTLVNTGVAHIFSSTNGIYVVTASDPRPTRLEWMHKADAAIYVGVGSDILGGFEGLDPFLKVNSEACGQFIGGYNQLTEEVWYSWPTGDNTCPNMSLVLNLRYEAADLVDHGFTAFTNYKPDYQPNIRDWLNSEGVCPTVDEDYVKEGMPASTDPGAAPIYIWNPNEDPTEPIHANSWCARLNGTTMADLCNGCESEVVFLMASASDFSIKEYDEDVYYRQAYNSSTGAYSQNGYYTMLQSDMSNWGVDEEKRIKQVLIDFDAVSQSPPSTLTCEVAFGSQPRCSTWIDIGDRELRCLTESDEAAHESNNTRPDLSARYMCYYRGRYIAYRFFVAGVGGSSCFSRNVLTISKAQGRTH